ncbi:hypothetical protein J3F83DRAFT_682107 [Trichoderma novae-zelandiae]
MSFLTRTITKSTSLAGPVARIAAVRSTRPFTTSLAAQRTASETVKDGLKSVDRAVSDKLVDGIDMAKAASHKVLETAEDLSSSGVAEQVEGVQAHAKGKAQQVKGAAKGKAEELKGTAQEMKGSAKGKAEELKGTAQEMTGTAKGKAEELRGKTKGAAAEAKGKAKETADDVQSNLYD